MVFSVITTLDNPCTPGVSCRGFLLRHSSLLQAVQSIAMLDGGQTVGNDQDGLAAMQGSNRLHDTQFGVCVERAGGFVQNQHSWIVIKRACDAYALALTAGEPDAALAH